MRTRNWSAGALLATVMMLEPADVTAQVLPLARALADRQPPFIIGAPGRADGASDRREPRRRVGDDASLAAFVDVETVADATWLAHEVEAYAHRRTACSGETPMPCARRRRALHSRTVLAIARGHRAEVVWSAGHHAVRLGWRRVVETATGAMVVDDPPAELAAALLAQYPSDLPSAEPDAARWQEDEIDRLLYYAERVLDGWSAARDVVEREAAWRLVYGNLSAVRAHGVAAALPAPESGGPPRAVLAARVAALQAARQAARQCPAAPRLACVADELTPATGAAPQPDQNGMSSSP